jgi:hypothetical protein
MATAMEKAKRLMVSTRPLAASLFGLCAQLAVQSFGGGSGPQAWPGTVARMGGDDPMHAQAKMKQSKLVNAFVAWRNFMEFERSIQQAQEVIEPYLVSTAHHVAVFVLI